LTGQEQSDSVPFMPTHGRKVRDRDAKETVAAMIDAVTEAIRRDPEKNPAAVALGRLGGLKGGAARAKALSATRRKDIARKAAVARWNPGSS
jgi:hypothetical protein